MIKAQNLSKQYKNKIVVDDISFKVELAKVTGFLGPNGAGKSTTMRLMLGLDSGQGTTTFDGKRLREYPNPSRVVGISLDAKSFHPTRTARNHLRSLAVLGDVPLSRVDEVLDIVGLKGVAKKMPKEFSLGMSQRLGLAAAILGQPKYLILDEPANGLDPEGIKWLRNFLTDYASNNNAVFVSSHLLSEMSLMADNVIVIGKGKLIADTSVENLLARHAHSSVFVRSPDLPALEKVLNKAGKAYRKDNGGLTIPGVQTDDIGRMAANTGITILELTKHNTSLEEVFFDLTTGSQEYQARSRERSVV